MKKLLLCLFAVLSFYFGKTQDFYKVDMCTYQIYTEENGWVVKQTTYPENIFVIIKNNNIKITNSSKSSYVTFGEPKKTVYERHTATSWDSYDDEGKNCKVMIKTMNNESNLATLTILYDGFCFEYRLYVEK